MELRNAQNTRLNFVDYHKNMNVEKQHGVAEKRVSGSAPRL